MTSIYVTVPKSQEKHFIKDKKEGLEKGKFVECYWDIGKNPLRLQEDEEIHFVFQGYLEFYAKVTKIEGSKIWFDEIKEYADPISTKGFRGFRYFKNGRRV